ncbi:MAG: transcriptional regulator, MarR family [Thermoleophilia bacterium]|nr:transcriptional regulator, MarR family [Thermoleophilia bacterium]
MINETVTATDISGLSTTSETATETGRMSVALSGLFAQWLRGLTINAHERLAIAHLWEHGSMTMSEVGARIPLSRAAITALTDRLEALNYVIRTPDAHDRRRTVLSLTDRPAALIADLSRPWNDAVETFEQGFSADELQVIARWTTGLKEIAHRESTTLRARRDEELPAPPVI